MSDERAARRSGRVGGPLVVALVLLLTLVVALAATWLARRIVPHDRETEAVRPESTQPDLSGLEAPAAPLATEPPTASSALDDAPPPAAREPVGSEPVAPGPDPLDHVLWGYVLDAAGNPIPAGAYLSFTDVLGERLSARAGPDGAWSMSGLASGRWFVSAGADGFVDAEAVLALEPGTARVRRDFTLERRGTLLVRVVTPDGRAFAEADAERAGQGQGLALVPVATAEPLTAPLREFFGNGSERIGASRVRSQGPAGAPGGLGAIAELELFEPLPLHVTLCLFQEPVASQRVEPGAEEVVFVLDPAELARWLGDLVLTAVDEATGAPVEGVEMTLGGWVLSVPSKRPGGRLERRDELPGRYDLHVRAPGYESQRLWLELAPGQTLERTIPLRPGVAVSGRAVDEQGQPFQARVEFFPAPAEGEPPGGGRRNWVLSHSTRPDGTFELSDLGPGRWLLQLADRRQPGGGARLTHMSPNVVVDTLAGPVTGLVVHLEPVSHAVVSWSGPGREQLRLRFLDERGLVRVATRFWYAAPQRVALPPGNWRLRVVDGSGATVTERGFTLGAEPVALELGP